MAPSNSTTSLYLLLKTLLVLSPSTPAKFTPSIGTLLVRIPSSLVPGMIPSSFGRLIAPPLFERRTFKEHAYRVYSAAWNPCNVDAFASAFGDCTIRVWDVREPGSTMIIPGHEHEILSCYWNKFDECLLATGSVDKTVRVWDVRSFRTPIVVLAGHGFAVRKVKCSSHNRNMVISCSYDMTVCQWDFVVKDALIGKYDHHTEFAVGMDMSVLVEGLLASTGWDEMVHEVFGNLDD